MSFINPYNQSGMLGATGYDRPSWRIPTTAAYTPSTPSYGGGGGFFDVGTVPGSLASTAGDVTGINIANQQAVNQARIPNAVGLEAQSSKMIEDELLGKLPADVMALLGTQAGERGVAGGVVGAPNAGAAYLRALGLTSLDQQQRGQQNLSAAYARNPAAPIMNAEGQIITPLQQAQLELEREKLALERSRLGGGGGGGGGRYGSPVVQSEGSGGYIPTASSLFGGYGGGGMIYSPERTWQPTTVEGAIADQGGYGGTPRAWEGYSPTSSGTMYMGDIGGYDPETANYFGGDWMNEIFGGF